MVNPGDTVRYEYEIPFAASNLSEVVVTFKQHGSVILKKVLRQNDEGLTPAPEGGKTIVSVVLLQPESLSFDSRAEVFMQINVLTVGGTRLSSVEMKTSTGPQHYREVIGGG